MSTGAREGWLWAAAAAFIFPCLLHPLANPDLYWHLNAGRWIAERGALPRQDFLSHTLQGSPWLDFEWLTQLLYHGLLRFGGFGGLWLLRQALLLGAGALLWRSLRAAQASTAAASLGLAWAAAALYPLLDLRPDNVSLLFFAALIALLEDIRLGRRKAAPGLYGAMAALFALWSNFHLGLFYGLWLIGLYAAGEAARALLPAVYGRPRLPLRPAGRLAALAAAGALGSLLNPFGWRVFGVLFEHVRSLPQLVEVICEWKPPNFRLPLAWPYAAMLVSSLGALLWHFLRFKNTPWAWLLGLGYFALASASHQRHLPYFVLLALPVMAGCLRELAPRAALRRAGLAGGALLLAAFVGRVILPHSVLPGLSRGWHPQPPRGVADFLEAESAAIPGRRLYNSWGDGGYLGWRLWPRFEVYQDGRYIFHSFLEETQGAARSAAAWQALMERRGVEVACVKRSHLNPTQETVRVKGGGKIVLRKPYYASYLPRAVWALVYWDEQNLVFVRRAAADRAWLARMEYTVLLPDHQPPASQRVALGLADELALRRELARRPASPLR